MIIWRYRAKTVHICCWNCPERKKKVYIKNHQNLQNQKKLSCLQGHLIKGCRLRSFLVRSEWIIQGLSRDYPRTRRSVAHASGQLPSGSLFPSVLERKRVIFFNPTIVDYWVTLTSCSGQNQQSLEKSAKINSSQFLQKFKNYQVWRGTWSKDAASVPCFLLRSWVDYPRITQGLADQPLMHLSWLPSGSLFPSVLERKHAIF